MRKKTETARGAGPPAKTRVLANVVMSSSTYVSVSLLNENDKDGRMAILMVTGYAQRALCLRITEKVRQTVTRTMPPYNRKNETH